MATTPKATKATAAPKTTDAAGRRKAVKGEPPLANYADKAVTPVIQNFADWIEEQTGVKVDPQSVFLGSALRGQFQKSEQNQARLAARKAELEAETKERELRAQERAARKEAAKSAPKAEPKEKAAPKTATAKTAAKPATKAAAAKPAAAKAPAKTAAKPTTTRRRPAAKPTVSTEEF